MPLNVSDVGAPVAPRSVNVVPAGVVTLGP